MRDGIADGNTYEVIFHIPVPAGNNRAGVAYPVALIGSGRGGTTVMKEGTGQGEITAAEKAQIESGTIYEVTEPFATNPGEAMNVARNRIDARFNQLLIEVPAKLQNALAYWGYDRDVP